MDMEEKNVVKIVDTSGTEMNVSLVTFLMDNDSKQSYIVYTKNEKQDDSYIIYISKIFADNDQYEISEITSKDEWIKVQGLLKKIANAK